MAQIEHGWVSQMCGQEWAHDPPGLLAIVLNVDHPAEGADEGGQSLLGDVTKAHDRVEALRKRKKNKTSK